SWVSCTRVWGATSTSRRLYWRIWSSREGSAARRGPDSTTT
ncbi:uncharacterized protein METZ01_LOCUS78513, partial [marine metagenome]